MDALLFPVTAALLLAGWLYAEWFVRRRAARGTLVRALDGGSPAAWLQSEWLVRLAGGRTVTARASGCVQCRGGLQPGRRVGLLRDREGFVVALTEPACRDDRCGRDA